MCRRETINLKRGGVIDNRENRGQTTGKRGKRGQIYFSIMESKRNAKEGESDCPELRASHRAARAQP